MKKIVLVTGANGGIGMNYCREMLSKDYHVVMACRNKKSGETVMRQLKEEFPKGNIDLMLIDMGDLSSIKVFSEMFMTKYFRLDVLVHNAGVYFFDKDRKTSTDDIELNMAIHVIGPYALTARLFPLIESTEDARIISMSSLEHHGSPIDSKDLQMKSDFSTLGNMVAYNRSKWATLALTFEMDRRLRKNNHNTRALAAHPGVSITGIQHKGNPTKIQKKAIWLIGKLFAGKPKDAAKPLVLASTIGDSGHFYGPTGFKEMKGKAGLVVADKSTKQEDMGQLIWNTAKQLSGLSFLE